jgi:hypothetical protein
VVPFRRMAFRWKGDVMRKRLVPYGCEKMKRRELRSKDGKPYAP